MMRQVNASVSNIYKSWRNEDLKECNPEERRFNVWNQTFTDGDPRKDRHISFFFPRVDLLNLVTPGIDRIFCQFTFC